MNDELKEASQKYQFALLMTECRMRNGTINAETLVHVVETRAEYQRAVKECMSSRRNFDDEDRFTVLTILRIERDLLVMAREDALFTETATAVIC